MASKTGGGVGTNQHGIRGRSVDTDAAARHHARAEALSGPTPDTGIDDGADSEDVPPFVWNNDYHDHAQVEPYYDAYLRVFQALADDDQYPYNDSFKGKIPGIAGTDNEDTGIYMLQGLRRIKEINVRRDAFIAEGATPLPDRLDTTTKYRKIMMTGFYVGGTGITEFKNARVITRDDGTPYAVLPKGQRTNGHHINGDVLVLR